MTWDEPMTTTSKTCMHGGVSFFFSFTRTLTHTSSGAFDFNHLHMPALGACFLFYM